MAKTSDIIGKLFGVIGTVAGIILVTLVLTAINGYFVKLFWNWLAVSILHLPPITWLEGCGLILLTSFLFRGGIGASNKN